LFNKRFKRRIKTQGEEELKKMMLFRSIEIKDLEGECAIKGTIFFEAKICKNRSEGILKNSYKNSQLYVKKA
jgi:hypothetical protein